MIVNHRNRDNSAYPEPEGGTFISLTKREQAAITILAGLVANQNNSDIRHLTLVDAAINLADELFDGLER